MKKKLITAVALAMAFPSISMAEIDLEISGYVKNETAVFTDKGTTTGAKVNSSKTADKHSSGDMMKFENSARIFINAEVGETASIHGDINVIYDSEGVNDDYQGHKDYTQNDWLRELYADVAVGDNLSLRIGKQQVVWGTADGMKLLDIMNPTDFREINQNTMEDARIPVWMINAEMEVGDAGNIQLIVAEAKENKIAGLNKDGDAGHPFIFKGVDTITGKTNGFVNIAEDMGRTSGVFQTLLSMGGLSGLTGQMALTTVSGFTALGNAGAPTFTQVGQGLLGTNPGQIDPTSANGALFQAVFLPMMNGFGNGNIVLGQAANTAGSQLFPGFSAYLTKLQTAFAGGTGIDTTGDGIQDLSNATIGQALNELGRQMTVAVAAGMNVTLPNSANLQDVANQAALGQIATNLGVNPTDANAFNTAIQTAAMAGMTSTSFKDGATNQFNTTLNTAEPTSAFDYMGNTTFGTFTNFIGMKTSYRNMHENENEANLGFRFKGSTNGGIGYSLNAAYRLDPNPYIDMHWEDNSGNKLAVNKTVTSLDANGAPSAATGNAAVTSVTTLNLQNPNGTTFNSNNGATPATLVFEEKLNRITTIGTSFDMSLDALPVPVVLRGEFSYDYGVKQPVIDRSELAIGNLTEALKMEDADMFKYVIGVDVTVMSNLLVSTQLIQIYNLNYIDGTNRYTGDFSTMHLTNGLNKGDEVETFVSFFLSKPFGDAQEHRWNNIIIAENGGGYWDRFDIEYSFSDELIGTFELNKYWGDENTTFGQFEKSSNVQIGLKWIIE